MKNALNIIMYIFLALIIVAVASVVIQDGAGIVANLANHIMGLFHNADIYPRPNGHFIQLLLIAIFVGWTINRFKRKK